jgi:alpha,alpha-trehalase
MGTIQTALLIPIDLNCLLYGMEVQLTLAAVDVRDEAKARHYAQCAKSRAAAIQRWCWDDSAGFFKDYHFTHYAPSASLHLGAVFPLCFRLATPEQAALVAEKLEKQFLHFGGLVTTLENTGQQWDAPNGWAPLQWMAYSGLKNYGFDTLAETIRERWVALNEKVYQETGKMMEKYNVMDADVRAGGGEYPNQDGFGWTNGVFSIFFEK